MARGGRGRLAEAQPFSAIAGLPPAIELRRDDEPRDRHRGHRSSQQWALVHEACGKTRKAAQVLEVGSASKLSSATGRSRAAADGGDQHLTKSLVVSPECAVLTAEFHLTLFSSSSLAFGMGGRTRCSCARRRNRDTGRWVTSCAGGTVWHCCRARAARRCVANHDGLIGSCGLGGRQKDQDTCEGSPMKKGPRSPFPSSVQPRRGGSLTILGTLATLDAR